MLVLMMIVMKENILVKNNSILYLKLLQLIIETMKSSEIVCIKQSLIKGIQTTDLFAELQTCNINKEYQQMQSIIASNNNSSQKFTLSQMPR